MFESRCGVCCSVCQLKDKLNCNECINDETILGEGKVKSCCEPITKNRIM
jgi:hypothetical protein